MKVELKVFYDNIRLNAGDYLITMPEVPRKGDHIDLHRILVHSFPTNEIHQKVFELDFVVESVWWTRTAADGFIAQVVCMDVEFSL